MSDQFNGRPLGKYVIQQEIGRGGMARVYRGFDTVLQRPVALKVLAPSLSADPEFARRFEREAITAANLRHPAIVTIFDVGEAEGLRYIAMEYIAGRTLNEVLHDHRVLSIPLTIAILAPVAEALDFAHSHGMVHRDVKPHNIMIDTDGRVLLTDFGIAIDPSEGGERLTRTGMFMGTPEYISPEQAQTQPLSGRSDIYSLGIVGYEMLAGRVPFEGSAPQLIMAHVYQAPPPVTSLNPGSPAELDRIFAHVLAKDANGRFETAGKLVEALRYVARRYNLGAATQADVAALAAPLGSSAGQPTVAMQTPPGVPTQPRPQQRPSQGQPAAFPIADVFGQPGAQGQPRPQPQRPPTGQAPTVPMQTPPAGIPMGSQSRGGTQGLGGQRQGGTQGLGGQRQGGQRGYGYAPPDDQFGPPPRVPRRRAYPEDSGSSIPWTLLALGAIAVAAIVLIILINRNTGDRVGANPGGSLNPFARTETPVPSATTVPPSPTFNPVLEPGAGSVPAETLPTATLVGEAPPPTEAPTTEPTVAPTDAPTAEPTAAPTEAPTAEPTVAPTDAPTITPTITPTVTLTPSPTVQPSSTPLTLPTTTPFPADAPTQIGGSPTLTFFDGDALRLLDQTTNGVESFGLELTDFGPASLSPDGTTIVFDAVNPDTTQRQLYLLDRARGRVTQLTDADGDSFQASWRPDGQALVFASTRGDESDIYTMDPDGDNVQLLTPEPGDAFYPSFSPDGTRILFESTREEAERALYTMDAQGGLATRLSAPGKAYDDRQARWAPDGQQIVFVSDRDRKDGGYEVYTARADGGAAERLTSLNSGSAGGPSWSPDGAVIAFFSNRNGSNDIYVVAATGGEPRAVLSTSSDERWPTWSR